MLDFPVFSLLSSLSPQLIDSLPPLPQARGTCLTTAPAPLDTIPADHNKATTTSLLNPPCYDRTALYNTIQSAMACGLLHILMDSS